MTGPPDDDVPQFEQTAVNGHRTGIGAAIAELAHVFKRNQRTWAIVVLVVALGGTGTAAFIDHRDDNAQEERNAQRVGRVEGRAEQVARSNSDVAVLVLAESVRLQAIIDLLCASFEDDPASYADSPPRVLATYQRLCALPSLVNPQTAVRVLCASRPFLVLEGREAEALAILCAGRPPLPPTAPRPGDPG